MAGAEFNINPFGRVAGGQEGSGQAQILEPFDATKYDRWAKEQGVKQEQAKALKPQLVKPIKPETIDEGRGEVKIKRDDVVDSINQGYTQFVLDEVIPLYDMRNSLVQAGVDIDKKYTNLDPNNVDDYNEKTKQRNAEWTELNGEIRKFKTQVAMSETAGKYIDNIAKIIADDSNNKLDLETTNRNKEYWLGKPVSEMIDYYQNNPIAVYKSKFDYLKFADSMSSLIDHNWRTNNGVPSPIEKDATSGMWVWNTSKGSSIDTVKFKNEIANTFRSTIANDPDAYNFMLSYKDKGAKKTYQQLAYEDNVSTLDKYAFADWVVDKKPDFIDVMIGAPEGWSTRTAIIEGGGGGNVVVTNIMPGTSASSMGGSGSGSNIAWNPRTYRADTTTPMIAGTTIPVDAIIDQTGNQSFTSYTYDSGTDKYVEQTSISGSGAANYQAFMLPVARVPFIGTENGGILTMSGLKDYYRFAKNRNKKPSEVMGFSPYTYQPATTNGIAGNALQPLTTNTNIADWYKQSLYNSAISIDDFWDYYDPANSQFNKFATANAVAQVATYYANKKATDPSFTPDKAFNDFKTEMNRNSWNVDKTFQYLMGGSAQSGNNTQTTTGTSR